MMEEARLRRLIYTVIAIVVVVMVAYASFGAYESFVKSSGGLELIEVTVSDTSGAPVPNVLIGFCGDDNPGNVWFEAWSVGETDSGGHLTITKETIDKQSEYAQSRYYVGAVAEGYVGGMYDHRESIPKDAKGSQSVSFVFEKYPHWYDGLTASLGSYTPSWYDNSPTIVYAPITQDVQTGLTTAWIRSTPEILLFNDGMAVSKFGAYIDFSNGGTPTVLWQGYDSSIDSEIHVLGVSFTTGASLDSPLKVTFQKSPTTAYGTYSLHICDIVSTQNGSGLSPVKSFDFGIMVWNQG